MNECHKDVLVPGALMRTIGENLIALRVAANLSQDQLAIAAKVHKNTVHNLETFKAKTVQLDTLERLADALATTVNAILVPRPMHDPTEVAASLDVYLRSDAAAHDEITDEEASTLRRGPWPWGPLRPRGWSLALEALRASRRKG
jgi:transcriptional regulator with XRE-family HTH domain